jgi:DNA-binding FrmR family transcriptional regulator
MIPTATTYDIVLRLRRAEGQVRGVQNMLADGRPCRDVLVQLSAAIAALERRGELFVVAFRHRDEVAADAPDGREGLERLLLAGR